MLRSDLAGAVLKLPRRISEDRAEPLPASGDQEVVGGGEHNEILSPQIGTFATANLPNRKIVQLRNLLQLTASVVPLNYLWS
jgi:hypothetical protein